MNLPELRARISLDLKQYNSDVKAAKKAGQDLEKQLENIKKVGIGFTAVGGAISASLGLVVKSFISTSNEIKDSAKAAQLSTDTFQQLSFTASQTGTDINALSMGIKTLARTVAGAQDGNKTYQESIKRIGLNYQDLIKMSPEKQLEAVGQAISAMPNPTQRAAASLELLGKSGTAILEATQNMSELAKESQRLGVVISSDVIEAGGKLGDNFSTISQQVKALVANLGASLAPVLMKITNGVKEVLASVINFVKENPKLVSAITVSVGILGGLALAFGGVLTAVTVLTPALVTMGITLNAALLPITAVVAAVGAVVAMFIYWEDVIYGLKVALDFVIKAAINSLLQYIQFASKALGWIPKIGEEIKAGAEKVAQELNAKIDAIDDNALARKQERERKKLEAIKVTADEAAEYEIAKAGQTEEELKKIEEERRRAFDARMAYEKSMFDTYGVERIKQVLEEEAAELAIRQQGLLTSEAAYYEVQARIDANRLAMQEQVNERILNSDTSLMGGLTSLWSNYNKKWRDLETGKVSASQGTMDALLELQSSGIKELATIGKAAAIAQATINTYQGATKAIADGGFWGIAMAAAVIAAGLANVAKIAGVTFAEGGIVPGNSFVGDNVLARVNSGEMVLNEQQQARLFALANGTSGNANNATGGVTITQEINIENGGNLEGIIDALRRGTLEALEMANLTVTIGNKQAGVAV